MTLTLPMVLIACVGVFLASFLDAIAGHYVGAGLTIKNGAKIVRPVVIVALCLLAVKVLSGLFS